MDTQKWIDGLDAMTVQFRETFGNLSSRDLNYKPAPDKWSIGQNIDHLIKINESYYPILNQVREGSYRTPFLGKIGFVVRLIGNWIMSSVKPDRRKKMKTFPTWEPSKSEIDEDILNRFEEHQQELKQKIRECSDALDEGVVINSPINRNIVYKLEKAFDIIVTHEKRHFEQAREVLSYLGGEEE